MLNSVLKKSFYVLFRYFIIMGNILYRLVMATAAWVGW